jgi:hypothetical protein
MKLPKAVVQLAAVAQDGDQRPDRRGRHRRPRIEEREHDAKRRQGATDPVRQGQRYRPPSGAEREREPANPVEVDLLAGEEEEHPQAEVREELDEVVDMGQTHDLRTDQDPQQQLDDDDRGR